MLWLTKHIIYYDILKCIGSNIFVCPIYSSPIELTEDCLKNLDLLFLANCSISIRLGDANVLSLWITGLTDWLPRKILTCATTCTRTILSHLIEGNLHGTDDVEIRTRDLKLTGLVC
ncbi:Acetylcholinesterase 1 [Frankliniella fusca]|uniref:Acetylcholinesterase 1 n=1 Tax=Frankliniella fusca TaxID=407009 RepID=A0AAE1I2J9_9NEOP|nr:Acetylcholinesterase 1 [Frankliniella fusca]